MALGIILTVQHILTLDPLIRAAQGFAECSIDRQEELDDKFRVNRSASIEDHLRASEVRLHVD